MIDDPWVQAFLDSLSTRTAAAYRGDLELYLGYIASADKTLQDVQRYHLSAFEQLCQKRGESTSTTRRRMAAVRSLHRFLNQNGYRPDSPAAGMAPTPTALSTGQVLRLDEVRQCFAAAAEPGFQDNALAMMLFLCYRVRADDAVLISSDAVVRKGRSCTLFVGGGQAPIPKALRQYLPYTPAHAPRGCLLGGRTTPLARQTVGRWVAELGELAGLPIRISPRLLLRSAAPVAIEAGVPPAIASRRDWFGLEPGAHPALVTGPMLGAPPG